MRILRVGLVITAALATVALGPVYAQDGGPRFGVVAGVNLATLSGDDVEGSETKIGFLLGATVTRPLTRTVALETGAIYTQRGTQVQSSGITEKININYIEVPALLAIRFPGQSSLTPSVAFGPAVAFKAGCGYTASGGGGSVGTGCGVVEDELEIGIKTVDFGLVGALAADFQQFRVSVRYYMGMTTIDNVSPAYDIKNRVLSLSLGYFFGGR